MIFVPLRPADCQDKTAIHSQSHLTVSAVILKTSGSVEDTL
jgi:hypothetical protein